MVDKVRRAVVRSDRALYKSLKRALSRSHIVDAGRITFDVASAVVRVGGLVNSTAEKLFVESVALAIPGVKFVVNNIAVKPVKAATDARITGEVLECLSLCLKLDLSRVFVTVHDGIAFLEGTVTTFESKVKAVALAGTVAGVWTVVDRLVVVPA